MYALRRQPRATNAVVTTKATTLTTPTTAREIQTGD